MLLSSSAINQMITINDKLAAIYIKKAQTIKNNLNLPGELEIKDILGLPNVIEKVESKVISEKLKSELFKTVEKAVLELDDFRKKEGIFLQNDLLKRITTMETLINEIEPLADKLPKYYMTKLQKRLEEENISFIDDNRLLKELVIYSDRCDVSEEIARLKNHFMQFRDVLALEGKPVGKRLDFITQEIQREINTLGVKAASIDISSKVIQFKTETEKIREQIQNVE